jgi:hypothetical protein
MVHSPGRFTEETGRIVSRERSLKKVAAEGFGLPFIRRRLTSSLCIKRPFCCGPFLVLRTGLGRG